MKSLTQNQLRILATIALYTDKSKPKPPTITSSIIKKELQDIKQGTITSTLNQLEHRYGLVISVQVSDIYWLARKNAKTPGTIRKYFITGLGKKTVNYHLLQQASRAKTSLYEKLFRTTNKSNGEQRHILA
jgi:hypothetical protein|tara:strand:+ start:551 stop:943 length:393 start_codon:yes stop_codon:yes gene_type:complete